MLPYETLGSYIEWWQYCFYLTIITAAMLVLLIFIEYVQVQDATLSNGLLSHSVPWYWLLWNTEVRIANSVSEW
jgi:hypothetical protein